LLPGGQFIQCEIPDPVQVKQEKWHFSATFLPFSKYPYLGAHLVPFKTLLVFSHSKQELSLSEKHF
jgi:hypothetical protein